MNISESVNSVRTYHTDYLSSQEAYGSVEIIHRKRTQILDAYMKQDVGWRLTQ